MMQENLKLQCLELGNLIDMVRIREMPFDKDTINKYYEKYISIVGK